MSTTLVEQNNQLPTCRTAGGQKAIGQIARDICALAAGVAAIAEELES